MLLHNQNHRHQNLWTTHSLMKNCVIILVGLLVYTVDVGHTQSPKKQLINSNKCETPGPGGTTTYEACVGDSQFLFRNAPSSITVTPAGITCGTPADDYCPFGFPLTACTKCDASTPALAHPLAYLTDNTLVGSNYTSWWQSKSWIKYPAPLQVVITAAFNKSYELQDDIIMTFKGSRPAKMTIEKSSDNGQTWQVWQNYERRCATGSINMSNPDTVICTNAYSQPTPYTNGQVKFPITKERFGLFLGPALSNYERLYEAFNNTELQPFLTFTDIRFKLETPMTDGLQSLGPAPGNLLNLLHYYYAISDIHITASCSCNQHAKYCNIANGSTTCDCMHNTEGIDCERCKPLYNNRPWQKGSFLPYPKGTANECQKCECNDHALSCTYNSTLEFGECDNCTHNTTGVHCERCVPTFYKTPGMLLNSTEICTACGCELLGVVNNNTVCKEDNGQCPCKVNVIGRQCNTCSPRYYGLLLPDDRPGLCKECSCNTDGTVSQNTICNVTTGQCPCKQTTTGRDCSQCKDDFYSFPTGRAFAECMACSCNLGGSTSSICNKTTGQCNCRANITGQTCDGTSPKFYTPALDSFKFQPQKGTCTAVSQILTEQNPFTGREVMRCEENQFAEFDNIVGDNILKQPNVTWTYIPAVRYNLNSTAPWENATLEFIVGGTSSFNVAAFPGVTAGCPITTGTSITYAVNGLENGVGKAWVSPTNLAIDLRCVYNIKLTMLSKGAATSNATFIDSVVLFPDHESSLHLSGAANSTIDTYKSCIRQMADLSTRDDGLRNSTCSMLGFSTMSQLVGGSLPCNCNTIGSQPNTTCASVGGECRCKPGVFGRTCDQCAPGYYNFTATGCTPCNCDPLGSSNLVCDLTTGQCPCRTNVASAIQTNALGVLGDLKCSACLRDYFGKYTGKGCQPCQCDQMSSNSSQCTDLGVCTCKDTVTGTKCDTCQPGYYSRSATGCIACNCSISGSVAITCNQVSGICTCKGNVQGNKCDTCTANSFNLNVNNPDGCQRCFCYGHGTQCSAAQGYSSLIISTNDVSSWSLVHPTGPQVDLTHRKAPAVYLGQKISSYAKFITMVIQTRANQVVQLESYQPLIIQGNGKTVFYNATSVTATPTQQTLKFLLHESMFYYIQTSSPDYFNFYAILANIQAIYIQRKFGTNVVDLSNVTMGSTQTASPGATPSNCVENCTCQTNRNVQGLSCETCNKGNKRSVTPGSSYDTCVACNCNKRGETTPPLCNENTGVCLNCRNGTMGQQCESCSANVNVANDCTVCVDTYWGLAKNGCQACNCHPVGSVTGICDKNTGKCTCKPNVNGDKCNQCADNYYNLTANGCVECDSCYGLILNDVIELRQMRDNLTSYLTQLRANDSNAQFGSFSARLSSTVNSMGQLTVFLSETKKIEGPMLQDIARLNITLNRLRYSLDVDAPSAMNQSKLKIQNTTELHGLINTTIGQINSTLMQAYQTLNDSVDPLTKVMTRHVDTINNTFYQIMGESDSSMGDVIKLSREILSIENITKTSHRTAVGVLNVVNNTILHHGNNTIKLTDLQTLVNTTDNLGLSTNRTAKNAEADATATMADIVNVTRVIDGLSPIKKEAVDKLITLMTDVKKTAEKLRNDSSTLSAAQIDIKDVRLVQAQDQAAKLVADVDTLKSKWQAVVTELQTLYTTAQTAKNLSDSSMTNATNMLDIMRNFTQRAQAIEARANVSLETVQEVNILSQTATAQAKKIIADLQGTLTNSQNGLKGVQDALAKAKANNGNIQPLTMSSDSLQQRFVQNLGDVTSIHQRLMITNNTYINPAQQTCNIKTGQPVQNALARIVTWSSRFLEQLHWLPIQAYINFKVVQLESDSNRALASSNNISQRFNTSKQRVDKILTDFQKVNNINQNDINSLRTLVTQNQQDLDNRKLQSAVENLNTFVTAQKTTIANLQARKTLLAAQIQRLKDLKDQLKN